MGSGYWTRESFVSYNASRGRTVNASGHLDSKLTDQQIYLQKSLHPLLDPKGVTRECCDSAEHPATIPVILALDVTGSMGRASAEVAKKMNEVMTRLYDEVKDVEFMVMGIGDLAYDRAPIQISQFESDVRIAEQLDLIWMEHGGGGNLYESYTAAWYMGYYHCKLDCWKRGKKGLIITMGDEPLNPYLPHEPLSRATGDALQEDVDTGKLYQQVLKNYDLYHLHVSHRSPDNYLERVKKSFGAQLGEQFLQVVTVDEIAEAIVRIVKAHAAQEPKRTGKPVPARKPAAPAEKPAVKVVETPVADKTKGILCHGDDEDEGKKKRKKFFGLF